MPAELIRSIAGVRAALANVRQTAATVGLVPTMGALHAGHARLIERARQECDAVIVSVFINPIQFDREDDLRKYPQTLDADLELCSRLGADLVFAPSREEMYPSPPQCTIAVGAIGDHLCGHFRPGHFNGVATVVLKLFDIVGPDRAYFGEKDAQQLAIVRRLVADFNAPVEIVGVATVRESDGLALSSRNRQLDSAERQLAPALYHALQEADRQIAAGLTSSDEIKRRATRAVPVHPSLRLEYFEIVDPADMQPVQVVGGPVRIAGALWVGTTRLIDNILSTPLASN